ncbi:hypothetical protein [Cryobacterium sp. AP23]
MMQDEEHTDRVTRLDIEAAEAADREQRQPAPSAAGTKYTDLIAEVRDLFAEGWCICRSATLGDRVLEALEFADRYNAQLLGMVEAANVKYVQDTDILFVARKAAERALEAATKPRTVTDAHEIDALPDRTVVIDKYGDVMQYRGGLWCGYESAAFGSEWVARKFAPLTILSSTSAGTEGATDA